LPVHRTGHTWPGFCSVQRYYRPAARGVNGVTAIEPFGLLTSVRTEGIVVMVFADDVARVAVCHAKFVFRLAPHELEQPGIFTTTITGSLC
jgi:hypothetical protein